MEIYNKNRDQNRSLHDEIREQNAKLKNAPFKEKLAYFKEYYLKASLAILAATIFVGYLAYTILSAPDDTAFGAFFYNCGISSNTDLIDGFTQHLQLDTKKHDAYIDTSMTFSADEPTYESYIVLQKAMAIIATGELDIIVGDNSTIDYYARNESFHDITTILPPDLLESFDDRLYFAKVGETETLIPVGVYITDAPQLTAHGYYIGQEPVLSFVINSNSIDNAIEFLRYLYME